MNRWLEVRRDYAAWLRTFPMLVEIGRAGDESEILGSAGEPGFLDAVFWSLRTHEAETRARRQFSDSEIEAIFDEVAAVVDEDLGRFDPLIAYYARFAPDGDPARIEWERDAAHGVKRDLAWAAIERALGEPSFFSGLLPWYERGRRPVGWSGAYPAGHVLVI